MGGGGGGEKFEKHPVVLDGGIGKLLFKVFLLGTCFHSLVHSCIIILAVHIVFYAHHDLICLF